MSTWKIQKLGDAIEIFNGKALKAESSGPFPVYGSNGKIGFTSSGSYRKAIILGRVGAYCGSVMFEKDDFWASDNTIIVKNTTSTDLRFIYYLLKELNLNQFAGGAAQPLITHTLLRQIKISIPKLPVQSRIASVLSFYDDLIENNKKRIDTLEELASRLYTEWFVSFRFPNHEKMRMIDSGTEFGIIPEGWKTENLGDAVKIQKGKNITKETVVEGNIPVVAGGVGPAYFHNKPNTDGPVVTISASGANAGFVRLYYQNIWASDCSFIDRKSSKYIYYYYLFLLNNQEEITLLQRGSAQPHVYPKDLMGLKILSAPDAILDLFDKHVLLIFELVGRLAEAHKHLSRIRDLLIPQLVTGKREVK